jgi:hypothetical protein
MNPDPAVAAENHAQRGVAPRQPGQRAVHVPGVEASVVGQHLLGDRADLAGAVAPPVAVAVHRTGHVKAWSSGVDADTRALEVHGDDHAQHRRVYEDVLLRVIDRVRDARPCGAPAQCL